MFDRKITDMDAIELDTLMLDDRGHNSGSSSSCSSSKTEISRQYSAIEVADHNTESDCWVIIDRVVLDISDFIRKHPGGKGVLLRKGRPGTDVTAAFDQIGHSRIAREMLKTYQVGVLASDTSSVPAGDVAGSSQSTMSPLLSKNNYSSTADMENGTYLAKEEEAKVKGDIETVTTEGEHLPDQFDKEYAIRWHGNRRNAILRDHPEISNLMGSNPWTCALGVCTVIVHSYTCLYVQRTTSPWYYALLLAYTVGAVCKMWQFAINHDICHGTAGSWLAQSDLLKRTAMQLFTVPAMGGTMHTYYEFQHIGHHASLGSQSLADQAGGVTPQMGPSALTTMKEHIDETSCQEQQHQKEEKEEVVPKASANPTQMTIEKWRKVIFFPDSDGDAFAIGTMSLGRILLDWATPLGQADQDTIFNEAEEWDLLLGAFNSQSSDGDDDTITASSGSSGTGTGVPSGLIRTNSSSDSGSGSGGNQTKGDVEQQYQQSDPHDEKSGNGIFGRQYLGGSKYRFYHGMMKISKCFVVQGGHLVHHFSMMMIFLNGIWLIPPISLPLFIWPDQMSQFSKRLITWLQAQKDYVNNADNNENNENNNGNSNQQQQPDHREAEKGVSGATREVLQEVLPPIDALTEDNEMELLNWGLRIAASVGIHTWLWVGLNIWLLFLRNSGADVSYSSVFKGLFYLYLSELFLYGFAMHPFMGYFLGTHRSGGGGFDSSSTPLDDKNDSTGRHCQPTMSTYSLGAALCSLNLTLHVEHHDFPSVPWNRLSQIARIAPEYYEPLEKSPGFCATIYRWINHSGGWGYACQ